MNTLRRLVAGLGFIMFAAAATGCGTEEADLADTSAVADELKATGSTAGASVNATSATYGGYTLITLHPGRYASDPLTVSVNCYQGGTLVYGTPSWELHYAVQQGLAGYSYVDDHYEVVQGPLNWASYAGGTADCTVIARRQTRKGGTEFARASFTISPP